MTWKQRTCAVLIWSTSAYTLGHGMAELTGLPLWACLGLGGLAALLLIVEAGRP